MPPLLQTLPAGMNTTPCHPRETVNKSDHIKSTFLLLIQTSVLEQLHHCQCTSTRPTPWMNERILRNHLRTRNPKHSTLESHVSHPIRILENQIISTKCLQQMEDEATITAVLRSHSVHTLRGRPIFIKEGRPNKVVQFQVLFIVTVQRCVCHQLQSFLTTVVTSVGALIVVVKVVPRTIFQTICLVATRGSATFEDTDQDQ
mmetsp:Transcript_19299/g.27285  ORF Transcript_19299/g.27285 Transcript_19299/m.27285 type:complete len:202 (+) Transcript_19299:1541-2146(+)